MTETAYCKKCGLKSTHPGITLNEKEICNLCNLEIPDIILNNIEFIDEQYKIFENHTPDANSKYDYLLMLSGGKDSIYMLDKFANVEKKKVLAYTFHTPFESESALKNIERIKNKFNNDFVIESSDAAYKKLMNHLFNNVVGQKPGNYLDEKIPCVFCSNFFMLSACLHAYKKNIPFVFYCADPMQMVSYNSNLRQVITSFIEKVGKEFFLDIFPKEMEELIILDDEALPKIVFPFLPMRATYDGDKIIAELKQKGYYESSPIETHCSLFPLLNYYSFKHWDCMLYKHESASDVRKIAFSYDDKKVDIQKEQAKDLISIEQELKGIITELVSGKGLPEEQNEKLMHLFKRLQISELGAKYLSKHFISIKDIGDELGVEIK